MRVPTAKTNVAKTRQGPTARLIIGIACPSVTSVEIELAVGTHPTGTE